MKKALIDRLVVALVLTLCALVTAGGYLFAKAQDDVQRNEYLNAAAQGVFESITTQILRTSESLRIAAIVLGQYPAASRHQLALFADSVPHLVRADDAMQWQEIKEPLRPQHYGQIMIGRVQGSDETPEGRVFDLLTPVPAPSANTAAPVRPPWWAHWSHAFR